ESSWLPFVLAVAEHGEQTFFTIDDMFRPRKSLACKKHALSAHASRPWIDCVLHVGQLACRDGAGTKRSRRADANGRNHLLRREIEHTTRCDRRGERAQCGVMPAVFAHSRSSHFAKTHFNFVGNNGGEN